MRTQEVAKPVDDDCCERASVDKRILSPSFLGMLLLLKEKLLEVVKAVAPLFALVCLLQLAFVDASITVFVDFLAGVVFIVAGMLLLFTGADYGILPMGTYIGSALPEKGSILRVVAVAFAYGFATTVAEPDAPIR